MIAAVLAVLAIVGIAYEQIGLYRDRHRHEQIGRSVDIGGRTLNIFCSGSGGPPRPLMATLPKNVVVRTILEIHLSRFRYRGTHPHRLRTPSDSSRKEAL